MRALLSLAFFRQLRLSLRPGLAARDHYSPFIDSPPKSIFSQTKMQTPRTVVLGEASEESEGEELVQEDNQGPRATCRQNTQQPTKTTTKSDKTHTESGPTYATIEQFTSRSVQKRESGGKGIFGSNLLASIGSSSSTLTKLANYAPYNLLPSSLNQSDLGEHDAPASEPYDDSMTPLHRTLFAKNKQLHASLIHLYKHPLQAASKGLQSINQRLVQDQKLIQEVDEAMLKLKRERANLDLKIKTIV